MTKPKRTSRKVPKGSIVQFRVDEQTRLLIEKAALRRKMTVSVYLREIVLDQLFDDCLCDS